ncbi:hypothetical protein BC940DRAFT_323239 [Gongronella butleri]|nr:hypothetical protein BC940DRAFT_323239 [Gongronella butleri]
MLPTTISFLVTRAFELTDTFVSRNWGQINRPPAATPAIGVPTATTAGINHFLVPEPMTPTMTLIESAAVAETAYFQTLHAKFLVLAAVVGLIGIALVLFFFWGRRKSLTRGRAAAVIAGPLRSLGSNLLNHVLELLERMQVVFYLSMLGTIALITFAVYILSRVIVLLVVNVMFILTTLVANGKVIIPLFIVVMGELSVQAAESLWGVFKHVSEYIFKTVVVPFALGTLGLIVLIVAFHIVKPWVSVALLSAAAAQHRTGISDPLDYHMTPPIQAHEPGVSVGTKVDDPEDESAATEIATQTGALNDDVCALQVECDKVVKTRLGQAGVNKTIANIQLERKSQMEKQTTRLDTRQTARDKRYRSPEYLEDRYNRLRVEVDKLEGIISAKRKEQMKQQANLDQGRAEHYKMDCKMEYETRQLSYRLETRARHANEELMKMHENMLEQAALIAQQPGPINIALIQQQMMQHQAIVQQQMQHQAMVQQMLQHQSISSQDKITPGQQQHPVEEKKQQIESSSSSSRYGSDSARSAASRAPKRGNHIKKHA